MQTRSYDKTSYNVIVGYTNTITKTQQRAWQVSRLRN